jgi:hypothetical protein
MWFSPRCYFISGPRPSLLHSWILAHFGLVGFDAFKQSVSDTNDALSAIDTPNSSSNAPVPLKF